MGRPEHMRPSILSRWGTPEALDAALRAYADQCKAEERVLTWAGTAGVAGLERTTLWRYLNDKQEGATAAWTQPLKDAARRVEEQDEEFLRSGKPVGAIFALKNRGWTDQT